MKLEVQSGFAPPAALEWTRANYGLSALSVHERAISMLRAQAQNPASMKLDVNGGAYSYNGVTRLFLGGQSPEFTAPANGTRLDVLYLAGESGQLGIAQGTAAVAITDPLELPSLPVGSLPLVAVHLAAGQESITESDLYDLRPLFNSVDSAISPLALIANATITSAVSSITFSNIPSTYKDLLLTGVVRSSKATVSDGLWARFNNDSGGNYDRRVTSLLTSYISTAGIAQTYGWLGYGETNGSTAGAFSPVQTWFMNYSNTSTWKTWISQMWERRTASANNDLIQRYCSGTWRSTAAVSSITLFWENASNFVSGCRLSLWGLR